MQEAVAVILFRELHSSQFTAILLLPGFEIRKKTKFLLPDIVQRGIRERETWERLRKVIPVLQNAHCKARGPSMQHRSPHCCNYHEKQEKWASGHVLLVYEYSRLPGVQFLAPSHENSLLVVTWRWLSTPTQSLHHFYHYGTQSCLTRRMVRFSMLTNIRPVVRRATSNNYLTGSNSRIAMSKTCSALYWTRDCKMCLLLYPVRANEWAAIDKTFPFPPNFMSPLTKPLEQHYK